MPVSRYYSRYAYFVENFQNIGILYIGSFLFVFFIVSSLGITFGMWVGYDGTFKKCATTAESLSYFGIDRAFIIFGIIAALWVILNGVLFSLENRLFISVIF